MDSQDQSALFKHNDLDAVYYQHFEDVWLTGDVLADPSGWRDTTSDAAHLLPTIGVEKSDFGRYYLDEGDTLGSLKDDVGSLVAAWEDRPLKSNEFTLYNSVSTATAALLLALKRLGIQTIAFETPAYSVTVNQAKQFGLNAYLIPTYIGNAFVGNLDDYFAPGKGPRAIWLTQPRMSLGFDQSETVIRGLLRHLRDRDFLIIDEATEQRYPSVLHRLYEHRQANQIVRIRGLLKPLGLNGIRIAAVLHSLELRDHLENTQEVLGASLDLFSLRMAGSLATQKDLFRSMLTAANHQVTALRRKADAIALGSNLVIGRLVNGYMGCLFVPVSDPSSYAETRRKLLEYCLHHRMPVILGATMHFAWDPSWEQIRINYFNRDHHITRAVEVLSSFSDRVG